MARKLTMKNGQTMADVDHGEGRVQSVFERGDDEDEEE